MLKKIGDLKSIFLFKKKIPNPQREDEMTFFYFWTGHFDFKEASATFRTSRVLVPRGFKQFTCYTQLLHTYTRYITDAWK